MAVPTPVFDAAVKHNRTFKDACRQPEQAEGQVAACQLLHMLMTMVLCLHSPQ